MTLRRNARFWPTILDRWLWLIVVVCCVGIPWIFVSSDWALLGLLVSLPVIAMTQWIRQHRDGTFRRKRNAMLAMNDAISPTCLDCGYDLSGLAADAACPECGFASRRPRDVLLAPHGRPRPPVEQPG